MGIVDKVMGSLSNDETRRRENETHHSRQTGGVEALAEGKPSEYTVDDRIGGTHTRNVNDAVTHERVDRHAVHEVTPIVDRERDQTEIHQKIQPVLDNQEVHTHHQHNAPEVRRELQEDISDDAAAKYRAQQQAQSYTQKGEQTHSTSVNAPRVHEHVNKHIVEEIQPVIERSTHQTEHHHTTQRIGEHITEAPIVHNTDVAKPISMSEFSRGGSVGSSHGARDVLVDDGSRGVRDTNHDGRIDSRDTRSSGITGASGATRDTNHDGRIDGRDARGQDLNRDGHVSADEGRKKGLVEKVTDAAGLTSKRD